MNKYEIIKALEQGKCVYWKHEGYKVTVGVLDLLYVTFTANDYMTGLQESEYQDCFIGD